MADLHRCDSACEEDHNYEYDHPVVHEEDCDCDRCHDDIHDPVTDHVICTKCLHYMIEEAMKDEHEKGVHGA